LLTLMLGCFSTALAISLTVLSSTVVFPAIRRISKLKSLLDIARRVQERWRKSRSAKDEASVSDAPVPCDRNHTSETQEGYEAAPQLAKNFGPPMVEHPTGHSRPRKALLLPQHDVSGITARIQGLLRLKRPPSEIEDAAKAMLLPINSHAQTPEATQTLGYFVEKVYFVNLEMQKRASTAKGYKARWTSQLKPRCESYRLRDFRTSDAQRILMDIARENPALCRNTLHHLRSLLSAIFKHAIQQGYLNRPNPIREVGIPAAPQGEETYAYSLEEVTRMMVYLPQPTYAIAALAAFTGLRRSELAGALWENYDGKELRVTQSVWEGHVNEPKTRRSKAPVPIIPALARILDAYRLQCGNPASGPMFKSEAKTVTTLNMNNVLNRMILPALNVCGECRK
jgi:integrase